MKLDDKNFRNHIRRQELLNEREFSIGEDTGFRDMTGEHILNGDAVRFYNRFSGENQIVLFSGGNYCVMHGCWCGERNPLDPNCYGKIDFRFKGKPRKLDNIIILSHAEAQS